MCAALDVLVLGMHYPPEHTGNAPYTAGMVAALTAGGHRVRVVTGYPHYP
jgi:colanic acid biosynthesis glycosyl transferase WcaI